MAEAFTPVRSGGGSSSSSVSTTQRKMSAKKASSSSHQEELMWSKDVFQLTGTTRKNTEKETAKKANRLNRLTIILLFTLGVAAGLVNGIILMINSNLCKLQASMIVSGGSYGIGLLYFIIIMISLVFCAACACKYGAKEAAGSGLPEFKYLLASELRTGECDRLVSLRIFIFKVIGLIFSVGGGLSVGSEGPLVHTAACIAYLLMKYVPDFTEILDSPSLCKQIFAASAAVGVSSAFNAPVGGLLFSIEVTSTFYLVSNYWRSFIAAMSGSVACNIFLISHGGVTADPLLVLRMDDGPDGGPRYEKWELIVFLLMGISFGYLAHYYLKLHQMFRNTFLPHNRARPLVVACTIAAITSILVYVTRAYSPTSVGVIAMVSDVFNSGTVSEMNSLGANPIGALFAAFLVRVFLTLCGTACAIPAGIFMPVSLIGGLLGRFVGHLVLGMGHTDCYLAGYALVGACAFASGITHTISVCVICLEMSGNIKMLLPCIVVSVVAAGITKANGLSVYDQGMLNKGLESFQLLLIEKEAGGGVKLAGDIMDEKVVAVPRHATIIKLLQLLRLTKQGVFPMIDETDKHLLGVVDRCDLYLFLRDLFKEANLVQVIRVMLPDDTKAEDRKERLLAAKIERDRKFDEFQKKIWLNVECFLFAKDEQGRWLPPPDSSPFHFTPLPLRSLHDEHVKVEATTKNPLLGSGSSSSGKKSVRIQEPSTPDEIHDHAIDVHVRNASGRGALDAEDESSYVSDDSHTHGEQQQVQQVVVQEEKEKEPSAEEEEEEEKEEKDDLLGFANEAAEGGAAGYPQSPESATATIFSVHDTHIVGLDGTVIISGGEANNDTSFGSPSSVKSTASTSSKVEQGHIEKAVEMSATYIWSAVKNASQSIVEQVDKTQRGAQLLTQLGLSPTKNGLGDGYDQGQDGEGEAAFDPLDAKLQVLFGLVIDCEQEEQLPCNMFPYVVTEITPLEQLYVLFEMVKVSSIFVNTNGGQLKGMISRETLLASLKQKAS